MGSDMEDVALVLAQETWIYLITINEEMIYDKILSFDIDLQEGESTVV